jgi:uncharacterized repeat protein (TIGR03806 family)
MSIQRLSSLLLFTAAACIWGAGDQALSARSGVALERAFPRLRFERPVFLTGAGDGSGRLFVVEQDGVIRVFANEDDPSHSEVFLDIREQVSRRGNEEGLLGLAFDPNYGQTGRFYVHYSSSVHDKHGVVSRFRVSADDPDRADPLSEETILEQRQPYRNHNGGTIAFGPDSMLYVSFGDGGSANDPHGNGQDRSTWLGAILRVDVSASGPGYSVPADNPFVDAGDEARPEVWAYGLRNVWRFAFDRDTGELWAGDIGQNLWEEVDLIVAGGNYGWNTFEASHAFDKGGAMRGGPHRTPEAEYGRGEGISITGGAVYRGVRQPALRGRYLYGDYATGNLWALDVSREAQFSALSGGGPELVCRTGRSIASFGEDDEGELFLTSFDGGTYRIVATDVSADPLDDWPTLLSETGLFASVADHEPSAQLLPYEVNAPFWSDGAEKLRYLALPPGETLGYREQGSWDVPVGTTLVKSFRARDGGKLRLLETRLIERTDDGWEAATYLWDHEASDATLAPDGRQFELWNRGEPVTSWHAPSSAECASCHVASSGFVLGLTTAQLSAGPDGDDDQISRWIAAGLVHDADGYDRSSARPHVRPDESGATLDARARTWLDVNCAMCHLPNGTGNAAIDLRRDTPLVDTGLVDIEPAQGDLERSILWQRVHTLGAGRMPNVGSNQVDTLGAELLHKWISSLR